MSGVWKESFSEKHQKKYWKNKETGETTYKDPTGGEGSSAATDVKKDKKSKAKGSEDGASGDAGASDWVKGFSEKKQAPFWKNKVTGESTWKDPTGGADDVSVKSTNKAKSEAGDTAVESGSTYNPDEWEEKFDKKKEKKYLKNKVTGKATYNDPSKEATKPAAEAAASVAGTGSTYNPDEWEEKFDKKKEKKYWKNKVTGKATYNDPSTEATKPAADSAAAAPAESGSPYNPDEWEEKFDKKKEKKYWKNKATGKATYNDPSKEAKSAAPAAAPAESGSSYNADEWEEKFDKKKEKKYWKNKVTGKATYNDPSKEAKSAAPTAAPAASAAAAVSDLWEEKFDKKSNRKYWKNKETGKSTFKDPATEAKKSDEASVVSGTSTVATASHAADWVEKFSDKHGRKYWKHKVTGAISWTAPASDAAVVASAPAAVGAGAAGSGDPAGEWVESYSEKHSRPCWKSNITGKTTYTKPAGFASSSAGGAGASASASTAHTRSVVKFAFTHAAEESRLESPLRSAPQRRLLQLRGALHAAELDVLQFQDEFVRSRRATSAAAGTASDIEHATLLVHSFKLSGLRSVICNEVRGRFVTGYTTVSFSHT
jgi:hypothetical protein